ncbi:hypothetical protein GQX73_g6895 [Xylaria multiplex]|uniref:Uncharacterized protein n=1 Tax=Xylaria multiplex TaxID=323545 RepID=A0A7C8MQ39_9PEZI|nr:hypothetical protein GQX73_g6895 [Xylaria multiplex]
MSSPPGAPDPGAPDPGASDPGASIPSASSLTLRVVAMAADDTFAGSAEIVPRGQQHHRGVVVAIVVCTVLGTSVIAYVIYHFLIRKRMNQARVTELEEGAPEEPIPLQDIGPVRDRETSYGTSDLQSSVSTLLSHQVGQHPMALGSNPPTQADLDVASGSHSYGSILDHAFMEAQAELVRRARERHHEANIRHHGRPLEPHAELPEPPATPKGSPKSQITLETESEYYDDRKQKMPITALSPPNFLRRENSKLDIAESSSAGSFRLVKSHSDPNLAATASEILGDAIRDHGTQPFLSSHKYNQGVDNRGHAPGAFDSYKNLYGKNKDKAQLVSDPGNHASPAAQN